MALPAGAIEFWQKDRNILQIGQFRKMKKKSMVGKFMILPGKRLEFVPLTHSIRNGAITQMVSCPEIEMGDSRIITRKRTNDG